MTTSSQAHSTFALERDYPFPVERVWAAFADPVQKAKWFGDPSAFDRSDYVDDFRVGGNSVEDGQWHGGPRSRFQARYSDIVEQQRIVYAYDMWVDERHLSTSLTTIAFEPTAEGTRLTFVEQGVYYDGLEDPSLREQGTNGLLDALGASLD